MSNREAASHEAAIDQAIRSCDVVVFCSNLTETGLLASAAKARREGYREIRMGMADAAMRERFRVLKAMTGQETLPQVFVDGRFIGGIEAYLGRSARQSTDLGRDTISWVQWLAYAGLLPFLAGLIGLMAASWQEGLLPGDLDGAFFLRWQGAYGAVILSFLGASHWGLVLAGAGSNKAKQHFVAAVIPALLAWVALLLTPFAGLLLLAVSFFGWWLYETGMATQLGLPFWYQRLRRHLSFAVIALLLISVLFA